MVRVSRLKGIFKKGYLPNWSEEVFEIVKVNRTKPITYIIKDAHDEIIKGSLYNEELQKTNQEVYRIERVLRKKKIDGVEYGFVKWLGYNNKFNTWEPMTEISRL